ncbi:hypothetical protein JCM10212_001449 [Sporobolomyces blumeae]
MSSEAGDAVGSRRKSGRVRKSVQRLGTSAKRTGNGRKASNGSGDDGSDDDDASSHDDAASDTSMDEPTTNDEAEDDDDFKVPKAISRGAGGTRGRKRKSTDGREPNGTASQSKRGKKVGGVSGSTTRKAPGPARKPRAKKQGDEEEGDEADEGARKTSAGKDFPIDDDNNLFNAVKSPNTALQTVAEDWVESYREDSGPAMAELVNFVLRCCGCNASVDEHQAEDENGIVENLKDIVDEFKQESNHAYPLISRSKGYKKFRSSLGQFVSKLINAAADDILFSTSFYEHFQAWTHALSSSQIRALRHTATVIVLLSIDALTTLELSVRKEHGQAMRAKDAEAKKNRKDKARLKDMEKQVQEIHERLEAVEEFEEEAYTSVFVNRYRDADYAIRAECIASLGNWMKLNPDHWIDGDYLRYIGWVLSDESKEARRDSVRALHSLYQKDAYIGKLHHFTDRFKGQLVDMAVGEHDLHVRVQAIHVVRQIDGHGLLEEEQRDEVAQLVFEKEKRVRVAAAEVFKSVLDEEFESRKTELDADKRVERGKKAKADAKSLETMLEIKIVAELLVKYGKALDGVDLVDEQDGVEENGDEQRKDAPDGASLSDLVDVDLHRGRIAHAVEALWDSVDALRDWETLLTFLLRDHSAGEAGARANGKVKGRNGQKKRGKDLPEDADEDSDAEDGDAQELPDAVKLTDEEESIAVEVLVACLAKLTSQSPTSKKDKEADDEEQNNIARVVIGALPRLFSKHQTSSSRMLDVLSVPRLIQLDHYHNFGTAYEKLWDDVKKQFLQHTNTDVLDQAVRTIVHMLGAADLAQTNQAKFSELEEDLVTTLRQAVTDKDVESATFEKDELSSLTAVVARLDKLSKVKNLGNSLDDTDGGQQTSVWEIVDSIVNRGRLGYREEGPMVEHALSILGTHLIWQLQVVALEAREAGAIDALTIDDLAARRKALLEKAEEFAVGTETNAVEAVKAIALGLLLDVHVVSGSVTSAQFDPDKKLANLRLECSEELQARCSGYVEAEIERYAEQLAAEKEEDGEGDEAEGGDSGSDTEMEESAKRSKKKGKKNGKGAKAATKEKEKRKRKTPEALRLENSRRQVRLVSAQRFERSISAFVRAVHQGVFDLQHSVVLLKHWGRLGATFDDFARLLMHDLRDEGNYGSGGDDVAGVVIDALQGALELYLDSSDSSDEPLIALGRNLVGVCVVRGAQLAVVSSIPSADHLRIHIDSINYIVKRVKTFEDTKRRDDRNKALSFFKALAHLVFGLDGRSALKAKLALDSALETNEIEVSATSKTWEAVRAYQKRLVTNMAKDPSIKARAQTQAKKGKGKAKQRADEDEGFQQDEDDVFGPVGGARDRSEAPDTPSRRSTRAAKRSAGEGDASQEAGGASPKRRRTESPAPGDEARQSAAGDDESRDGQSDGEEADERRAEEETPQGISGNLDNTLAEEADDSRSRASRENSVESAASLSDVKRRRGRK